MAELVDASDSKSDGLYALVGSSPTLGTKINGIKGSKQKITV